MAFDHEPNLPAGLTPQRFRVLATAGALLFAGAGAHVVIPELGRGRTDRLAHELRLARDQIELLHIRTQRFDSVFRYSTRYRVPADVAAVIYDAALREGIDPHLAFRLVKTESGFEARAVSSAGAVGLAQLMPSTAQALMPGVTTEQLLEPEINLRLGFRLLSDLIASYGGDLALALVDYNGGPRSVERVRLSGNADTVEYVRKVAGRH